MQEAEQLPAQALESCQGAKGTSLSSPFPCELPHLARCGVRQDWWGWGGSHSPYPCPRMRRAPALGQGELALASSQAGKYGFIPASSPPSPLLMGLRAARQLGRGRCPQKAGQGFKRRGAQMAATLGSGGASRPSTLATGSLSGARWRPPIFGTPTRPKVPKWTPRPLTQASHSPALTMASTSSLVMSPRNREIFSFSCLSFLYLGSSTFTASPGTGRVSGSHRRHSLRSH